MRFLFTFVGNHGHLDPLVPIARAARRAGHHVAFSGRPWMVPAVEALGFPCFPAGSDQGGRPERRPLVPVDREREVRLGLRNPRERARDLGPVCESWRPDVIVWDETDFGAPLVAERLAIPHASVVVTASGAFLTRANVGPLMTELRADLGLPPDPDLATLSRYLVLVPVPPSFRDPSNRLPPTAHHIRPGDPSGARVEAPAWLDGLPARPTVYVTLGTVFPLESGDLFARVLAGVAGLPVNVVATIGRDLDPAELGPQPPNVRVEGFVPQAALLPRCDLVVSHAGSGSVVGALARGLPMVLLPLGADQPFNADRCETLGVARVLDPIASKPETIGACVADVLADPSYRDRTARIRAECDALPGPDHAVELLERLGSGRQPVID